MSNKRNIIMMLSMVSGMASLLPANADCIKTTTYVEPTTTSTTYVEQPMQIVPASKVIVAPTSCVLPTAVLPAQTVKTTKTTVTTTAPNIIQPVASEPETIRRSVIMMGSTPAASSSSTMTESVSSPFPVYGNRLAAMNEQIDRSVANGWITAYQANSLRATSSRLNQMILNRSDAAADIDAIEHGLTGLNISIQDAMSANGQTAGLTRTY